METAPTWRSCSPGTWRATSAATSATSWRRTSAPAHAAGPAATPSGRRSRSAASRVTPAPSCHRAWSARSARRYGSSCRRRRGEGPCPRPAAGDKPPPYTRPDVGRGFIPRRGTTRPAPPAIPTRSARRGLGRLRGRLEVEGDGHLVAHHRASLDRLAPAQAVVAAVDAGGGREGAAQLAGHALHHRRGGHVERRRLRHAVQGQLTGHDQLVLAVLLHLGRTEGDGGVLRHVEEVGRREVCVALRG